MRLAGLGLGSVPGIGKAAESSPQNTMGTAAASQAAVGRPMVLPQISQSPIPDSAMKNSPSWTAWKRACRCHLGLNTCVVLHWKATKAIMPAASGTVRMIRPA